MAGFEIGGGGNPYDRFLADSVGSQPQPKPTKPGKKPALTPAQKRKLQELINGKQKPPKTNTKYGVNTPQLPPQNPPSGTHTKYGANTPQIPPQLPPNGGAQTKYGINLPKK